VAYRARLGLETTLTPSSSKSSAPTTVWAGLRVREIVAALETAVPLLSLLDE
jgi:hypothetical protein